jgi:hypothetical protein
MPVGGGLFQIDMTGMGPDWSYYTTRATTFADEGDCLRLDPSVKGQYLLPTHFLASRCCDHYCLLRSRLQDSHVDNTGNATTLSNVCSLVPALVGLQLNTLLR